MDTILATMVGREAYIAVYMMTNRKHGTLYLGVTSQLIQRVWQHREGVIPGFTKTHGLKRLVWFEPPRA
jgi:putative endonuclease